MDEIPTEVRSSFFDLWDGSPVHAQAIASLLQAAKLVCERDSASEPNAN
jgi:hypothetical protein